MSEFNYGGQALIEGVMMRGKNSLAMAVRKPEGDIVCRLEKIESISTKYKFFKWPFIRGTVALVESLVLGIKALTFSANEAAEDEEEELSKKDLAISIVVALGLGILLFFVTPAALAHLLKSRVPSGFWQNALEGGMRIGIFLAYVIGISVLKDIKRVFQYHGAEHKTIFAYESGEELSVENCRVHTTLHPRCGTSFLLIVMVISILFFSLFQIDTIWWRLLSRIIFLPVIAGISYEFLKFTGKYIDHPLVKIISWPGLMLQKITTKEPDAAQLEVAIAALKRVLEEDGVLEKCTTEAEGKESDLNLELELKAENV